MKKRTKKNSFDSLESKNIFNSFYYIKIVKFYEENNFKRIIIILRYRNCMIIFLLE